MRPTSALEEKASALEEKAASSQVAKLFLELNDLDDGRLNVFVFFEMVIVVAWVMNLMENCAWTCAWTCALIFAKHLCLAGCLPRRLSKRT